MGISVGRVMRYAFVLAVLLALPGPLGAQAGPDPSSRSRVSATAAVMLKGGKIADENRLYLGGWAGLVFGGKLAVGGGGFALLNEVELAGSGGEHRVQPRTWGMAVFSSATGSPSPDPSPARWAFSWVPGTPRSGTS